MKTFAEYSEAFSMDCHSGDIESDHSNADNLLVEIALCDNLSLEERAILVDLWYDVDKWYA